MENARWGIMTNKDANVKDGNKANESIQPNGNRVDLVNNRIYFYADVEEATVLDFNKHVQAILIKSKIHAVQNDMPLEHSGQIFLHIQSFGGYIFSGLSAMDTLIEAGENIPVTTLIDGCAASAATFLSVVGTRRLMRRNSYMLIHQLSSGMWGKFEDIKDEVVNLTLFMNTIRNIYGEYTKVPKRELDKILKKDIWWDSVTCKKYGLIDEII